METNFVRKASLGVVLKKISDFGLNHSCKKWRSWTNQITKTSNCEDYWKFKRITYLIRISFWKRIPVCIKQSSYNFSICRIARLPSTHCNKHAESLQLCPPTGGSWCSPILSPSHQGRSPPIAAFLGEPIAADWKRNPTRTEVPSKRTRTGTLFIPSSIVRQVGRVIRYRVSVIGVISRSSNFICTALSYQYQCPSRFFP